MGLQLLGELVVVVLGLPFPAAVVGLVALLGAGAVAPRLVTRAEPAADPLLKHLQLLFVPPGVGVVTQASTLAHAAVPLALAVFGSFVVGLLVAGWTLQKLLGGRTGP